MAPLLLQKAPYLSLGNLVEALEVLLADSLLDPSSKETLLSALLQQLSSRRFSFEPVLLDNLYVDKYRHVSVKKGPNVLCTSVSSALKAMAANEKGFVLLSKLCTLFNAFNVRLFRRLKHRETRVTSELNTDF